MVSEQPSYVALRHMPWPCRIPRFLPREVPKATAIVQGGSCERVNVCRVGERESRQAGG